MHTPITKQLVFLLVIGIIMLEQVTGQCLYPKWETTCQKYCLDHKLYNIQRNQCWSKDPSRLACLCNNQDFTAVIKALMLAASSSDMKVSTE